MHGARSRGCPAPVLSDQSSLQGDNISLLVVEQQARGLRAQSAELGPLAVDESDGWGLRDRARQAVLTQQSKGTS